MNQSLQTHRSARPHPPQISATGAMPGRISLRGRRQRGGWIALGPGDAGRRVEEAHCRMLLGLDRPKECARGARHADAGRHGHQMPGPVELGGPRCRRQASAAERLQPPHPQKSGGRHGTTAARHVTGRAHRPYPATRGALAADLRRACRPGGGRASGRRGGGGRLARGLRLGPPALAGAGPAGGRPVDHAGSDRHCHRTAAARPMVTPLARRRPAKVARETATLDRLSGGRLILGVGLGGDQFAGEFSKTGEEVDDRRRASMLDESLEILLAAWSGELVHHRGEHYMVDGMRFLPRPVQRPGVPVWVAGYYGKPRPMRRAAQHQGFFPLALDHPEQVAEIVADLAALRREVGRDPTQPYDVVVALPAGSDPAPYGAAGATWWLVEFPWDAVSVDQVRAVIRDGPAAPA